MSKWLTNCQDGRRGEYLICESTLKVSFLEINHELYIPLPDQPQDWSNHLCLEGSKCDIVIESWKIYHWPPFSCVVPQTWIFDHLHSTFPQHSVHFFLKCLALHWPRAVGRELYWLQRHNRKRWNVNKIARAKDQYASHLQQRRRWECLTVSLPYPAYQNSGKRVYKQVPSYSTKPWKTGYHPIISRRKP